MKMALLILILKWVLGAGFKGLLKGLKLQWNIISESENRFDYLIQISVENDYDLVGIALKEVSYGGDMKNSYLVTTKLVSGHIQDRFADYKLFPSLGIGGSVGNDAFTHSDSGDVDKDIVQYSWTIALDTSDSKDIVYENGKNTIYSGLVGKSLMDRYRFMTLMDEAHSRVNF